MSEILETVSEKIENSGEKKLNNLIAIIVAISASLMAVFNIKDNNIVQAMSQAQAHMVDSWSYFQAKSTKQSLAETHLSQMELQLLLIKKTDTEHTAIVEGQIIESKNKIKRYEEEKMQIKSQAENYQKEYDELNIHDDQFDLAEALLSLGLSILGITALTQKRTLFYFAVLLNGAGLFFGLAGFLNWAVHPDWLTQILG